MFFLGPAEWQAVLLSLKVSFWATIISLPLGILTAYALARWRFWGWSLLNIGVHLPLILPPVVTGFFLLELFGARGVIGIWLAKIGIVVAFHWTGAVLAASVMAFPLMVRSIRLSIEAIDFRLEQAAQTLGASPLWTFITVTLPLAVPGIVTGAILAFAKAMGEFGATITFVASIPGETRTIPSAIYNLLQSPDKQSAAISLVVISVIVSVSALILSELCARQIAKRLKGVSQKKVRKKGKEEPC